MTRREAITARNDARGPGRRIFLLSVAFHGALALCLAHVLLVAAPSERRQTALVLGDLREPVSLEEEEAPDEPPPLPDAPEPPPLPECEFLPEEALLDESPYEEPEFARVPPEAMLLSMPSDPTVLARPRPPEPPPVVRPPEPVVRSPRPVARPIAAAPRRAPAGPTRKAVPVPGNPRPRYPARAAGMGIEGVTLLRISVRADGAVLEVEIAESSGSLDLDREAVHAAKAWRFHPALEEGSPVASVVLLPIRFHLG